MPHIKNALLRYRIIDRCIRNKYKPYPTKRDLREACEEELFGSISGEHICDSTIEKDLFSMRMEFDAPIKYSKKNKGYYYEDPNFTINDIPLTEDDIESLTFAAKTLMQFKNVSLFRQFNDAIDKIVDRINISKDEDADQYIQFETSGSEGGSEFLPPLLEAIKQKRWVTFDYASFKTGILKPRKVIPLLLKQYKNRWYLISFDASKNDYITYALDRMEDLVITDKTAEIPLDFSPDNYFKYSIGITGGNQYPQNIIIEASEIASKYLDSLPLHPSQKIIEATDNGGYVFSLNVGISEELIREILSYGGDLKIIEPERLRIEVQQRAKDILKRYE